MDARGRVVFATAVVAAVVLIVSGFTTVFYVSVGKLGPSCTDAALNPALSSQCSGTGFDRHSAAPALLALAIVGISLLAARPWAWLAQLGVLALGLVVLLITLIDDLPQVTGKGHVGLEFEKAAAHPGTGFWLELVAGIVAIASGIIALRGRPQASP